MDAFGEERSAWVEEVKKVERAWTATTTTTTTTTAAAASAPASVPAFASAPAPATGLTSAPPTSGDGSPIIFRFASHGGRRRGAAAAANNKLSPARSVFQGIQGPRGRISKGSSSKGLASKTSSSKGLVSKTSSSKGLASKALVKGLDDAPKYVPGVSLRRIAMNCGEPVIAARIVSPEPARDANTKAIKCPRWMPLALTAPIPDAHNHYTARPYGVTDDFVIEDIEAKWFLQQQPPHVHSNNNNNNNDDDDDDVFDADDMACDGTVAAPAPLQPPSPPSHDRVQAASTAAPHWMVDVETEITRLADFQYHRPSDKSFVIFFVKSRHKNNNNNNSHDGNIAGGDYELIAEDTMLLFSIGPVRGDPIRVPHDVHPRVRVLLLEDGSTLWGIRGRDLKVMLDVWHARRVVVRSVSPLFYRRYEVHFGTECRGPATNYPNAIDKTPPRSAKKMTLAERADVIYTQLHNDLGAAGQWSAFATSREEICALVHIMPPKINIALAHVLAAKLSNKVSLDRLMRALRFERSITIDISDRQREQLLWVMFNYHHLNRTSASLHRYLLDMLLFYGWYVTATTVKPNFFPIQNVSQQAIDHVVGKMEEDARVAAANATVDAFFAVDDPHATVFVD